MMRAREDEQALRALVNEVISLSNSQFTDLTVPRDPAIIGTIQEKLTQIWYGYFSDGRVIDANDREILEVLSRTPFSVWPESFVMDAMTEYMRLSGKPAYTIFNRQALNPESRYLQQFAANVTSQSGEDGIIQKIFDTIGAETKWCVEFGAWDGVLHSNTHTLLTQHGWHGVLIEGNEKRFAQLKANFRDNDRVTPINRLVGFDPDTDSLDYILSQTDIPAIFDLLVVDIDGNDWHVWNALKQYAPRVVIIEHNPSIPNNVFFVQQCEPAERTGCSLRALVMLGKSRGYELICTTPFNGIFVRREEFAAFGIADNSLDAMHTPLMDGCLFHGYNSTIHALGMPSMIWDWKNQGRDWSKRVEGTITVHDVTRPC